MKTEHKIMGGIIAFTLFVGLVGLVALKKMTGSGSNQAVVAAEILTPADAVSQGDENAVINLVEFSDFQCPACAATAPLAKQLVTQYPGIIKLTYRHYPLAYHQHAQLAAAAAEAAGRQDKFWQMHDLLFEKQPEWESNKNNLETFINYAQELELDTDQFKTDLESSEIKNKISRDLADGNAAGVSATPSFYINGKKTAGFGTDNFNQLLEEALQENAQ